jgi:hypothetical protein
MAVNKAQFTIGASPAVNRRYDAVSAELLTIALEDPSTVLVARYELYDAADPSSPLASKGAPTLLFEGVSKSITKIPATVPTTIQMVTDVTGCHSWLVRVSAQTDAGLYVYERVITLLNGRPRKPVPGETTQASARGWADDWADLVEFSIPGGAGLVVSGAPSVGMVPTWNGTNAAWAASTGGGLDIAPVVACTTANVALTGAYTVDGRAMTNGDRYLAAFQTAPAQNGIYSYNSAGAHTRVTDMNSAAEFRSGVWFSILGGERYGGGLAAVQSAPTVLGTDPALFVVAEPSPSQDLTLSRSSADAVSSFAVLRKSRGTKATPTAHAAEDDLGRFVGQGHDGANYFDGGEFGYVGDAAGGTSKRTRARMKLHNGTAKVVVEDAVQHTATTTDATLTVVRSIPLAVDSVLRVRYAIVGAQNSSSNRAIKESSVTVRRSGSGDPVMVASSDSCPLFKDDAAWGSDAEIGYQINTTTDALEIIVKGKAATTIVWTVDIQYGAR